MPPDNLDSPNLRQSYKSDHFVGREKSIQECRQWFNQDRLRLLVVTAPPGMGKTWLFKHIDHDLQSSSKKPTLWFDVPIKNPRLTDNTLNDNELADWLKKIIDLTRAKFPQIRPFDPLVETSRMAEAFAEDLVKKCWPNQPVYIFVDGCDLLALDSWYLVERKIIEPIARQVNIRFLIALRDNHRLRVPVLRYSEKRINLPAFDEEDQGNKQIEKLASELSLEQKTLVDGLINPYISSYPGLNSFLFQQARRNVLNGHHQLNIDFWQESLTLLNHLPTNNTDQLTQASKCILVRLLQVNAQLDRKWTTEQASEKLDITITKVGEWINELRRYWFIKNEGAHYFIEDGLAQFLQAVVTHNAERVRAFLNEEDEQCR